MGVARPIGMSHPIDVEAQIENLRGLKTDLEACFWGMGESGNAGIRFAVGLAISQLGQRIGALEEVMRHHGTDVVDVGHLTFDETRTVARALDVVDGELALERGVPVAKLWPRVRVILSAADDLLFALARGEGIRTDEEQDESRRPRVVLPLVRSR
jgi:hypothetical protein